jgi:hypothetical protein
MLRTMPCNDVSERCEVQLDAEDRVEGFILRKDTCGAPVGQAQLLPHVSGHHPEAILDGTLSQFVPGVNEARQIDQFLLTKQFIALQAALAVYTGESAGDREALFVVDAIEHGDRGTAISGLLCVDLVTEKIRACGNCCNSSVNA